MVSVAIFDYGAGNIFSLKTAFEKNGASIDVITSFDQAKDFSGILLPGVGNFDPAIRSIRDYSATQFKDFVQDKIPVLGICLGMEMFFAKSEEGKEKGLSVLGGEVVLLPNNMKIPHMGWNTVQIEENHPIFDSIENEEYFYFVHSYFAAPTEQENILGSTQYGNTTFCSVAVKDNVIATQFHPEKSQQAGLDLLRNFCTMESSS